MTRRASEFLAELDGGPKATRKHGHDEAHVRAMADRRREKELEAREREAIRPSAAALATSKSLPPPPPLSSTPSAAAQSLPLPPPPPKAPADAASSRVAEAERAAAWERDKARQVNRREQQANDARYAQEEKMWELRERDKYVIRRSQLLALVYVALALRGSCDVR